MLISLGGKMPGSLLPEHQAETAAAAAATATAGGGHDASSNGSDERSDEPGRHGDFQPALRQGGAWRNASPPNDGTRGNAKPCQCRAWQAWIQRSPQPECAGSRQKGILPLHIFSPSRIKDTIFLPSNPISHANRPLPLTACAGAGGG